ncbi:hypothetical protein NE237_026985 [Protea cynaroides]|uniref:Glycoside hydrolase family 31 N-terminal domain-containing protein n=1 Tax=Protea cynaroides TaxID=273540 RepID=A0A9Q0GPA3_9MAGN|nr:hypothetical protein NE237_026985 [Protea cynaroides]
MNLIFLMMSSGLTLNTPIEEIFHIGTGCSSSKLAAKGDYIFQAFHWSGYLHLDSQFPLFRKQKHINNYRLGRLASRMAEYDGKMVTADVTSGNMIFEPVLEDGVFRFDCSENDRIAAYPSLSFIDTKVRDTPIMNKKVPLYIPTFECAHGKQIVNIELPSGTSFYGTGEVSGQLERTGKRVFTWNTDAWGYGFGTTSLYQSHPWVLAVLPTGEAFGVLADTTRRCEIDLRKEFRIKFTAEGPYPVITFGPFASPTAVLISLSHAIGTVFMPPKWSLGYHQCRWGYDTEEKVLKIARGFREKGIPCDVIWMDIDYMDGYRCFTFDQVFSMLVSYFSLWSP